MSLHGNIGRETKKQIVVNVTQQIKRSILFLMHIATLATHFVNCFHNSALFNKMATRAKMTTTTFEQHLNHLFNFEIVLHKNCIHNSVHKWFRISCPLFENCGSVVEMGSTVTF